MALRRITKELKELQDNHSEYGKYPNILKVVSNNDDLFTYKVTIIGTEGTPKGKFYVTEKKKIPCSKIPKSFDGNDHDT